MKAAMKRILIDYKYTWFFGLVLLAFNFEFLQGMESSLAQYLEYNRSLIQGGELWRFVTGHFVHWSIAHFFLDSFVFLMIGFYFEPKLGNAYPFSLVLSIFSISLSMLLFDGNMELYRGISGLVNTQYICALFILFTKKHGNIWDDILNWILGLGILVKVVFETIFHSPFMKTDSLGYMGEVAPLAHNVGFSVGAIIFFYLIAKKILNN